MAWDVHEGEAPLLGRAIRIVRFDFQLDGFGEAMALPARVFWKLENLAVRWGCAPGDIVGWATEGIIEIVTSIGLVQCGGTEPLVGLVVVCAEDIMPLFRCNRPNPKACMI